MPPKKGTTTATVTRKSTAKKTATATATTAAATKAATTKKTTTTKAAATKVAAAADKTAAVSKTTTTKTKTTATKAAAAPKKAAPPAKAAPAKKTLAKRTKAVEESDKENAGARSKAAVAAKRKREAEEEAEASESEEEQESSPEDEGDAEEEERAPKRAKTSTTKAQPKKAPAKKAVEPKVAVVKKPAAVKKIAAVKQLREINEAPTQVMDIFVFGEGSTGELGLGHLRYEGKKPIDVKRPRINHNLKDIVQVACGGMHGAALTSSNTILTWGVNDQGALGRDTTWEGGLRDADDEDSDSDSEDSGLNPRESTPAEVNMAGVPEGTKWAKIVASDSATFALATSGLVYGWGTFRSNEGILGFSRTSKIQRTPALIPELSKIRTIAAGSNHILALDEKNKIYAWGAGQQAQLARRLLERDDLNSLYPTSIGTLPRRAKAVELACGSYHSFVIDTDGRVIGWGLNNFAELGIEAEAGTDGGYILKPQLVDSLGGKAIRHIAGGEHHSLACTTDGELLTWGRIDGHQTGHSIEAFTATNTIWDDKNKPRVLLAPSPIRGLENVVAVAAGTDHSFAITKEGKVYSWGFSANYQTGQGTTQDIEMPTLVDNTAIRDRKIVWAGAGGQFSVLGALPE
ncbi:regulator of chromosome condensation 1/beta-lactamase-inhibitor protein II [Schizothecium vesticola]|uniref:Regulator of chromosome condensation 1/beta-lactamase-inhibitor protein II n=1 Tax=Schizothecium vesticola TaxID=314040 RepID=A0AA40K9W4_9PEZI|nr:regulator of chromosome condensation 1/beta-lactamase-inhibitor protein II [Schizothecium vesticola]